MWKIAGLHRLDDWEAYFGSPSWHDNPRGQAMHRSIHIERAGLCEDVVEDEPLQPGLHAVELFDIESAMDDHELAEIYLSRAERHRAGTLNLVLRRIGRLGPDPAHLAVWTFPA